MNYQDSALGNEECSEVMGLIWMAYRNKNPQGRFAEFKNNVGNS